MGPDFVINVLKICILTGASVVAPILLTGLVVGITVGALQAATQVNEPTLTFVPKVLAVGGVGTFLLPWGLDRFAHLFNFVFEQAMQIVAR